jgi:hypothetical protein
MTEKRLQRKLAKIKKNCEQRKQIKELEDYYAEYMPDRKKRKVSNVMLITIVVAIVGYVIASFWLQYRTGLAIDPTITTCWFGFWTVEIIALTTIKNNKTKHSDNTYE